MSRKNGEIEERATEIATSEADGRRDFLKKAGRFAAVTPPAITLLLGTSLSSRAIAASNGSKGYRGNNGWGNGWDPTNKGSFHGNGVSHGGPGAGQSQKNSKTGGLR